MITYTIKIDLEAFGFSSFCWDGGPYVELDCVS